MRFAGLAVMVLGGFVLADATLGQAPTSALTGLNRPATISTNTIKPSAAMSRPNTVSPLQTPIRQKSPSFVNLPRLSLTTWPPRFGGSSFLPRISNPFQPKKLSGTNPFDAPKKIINPPTK